MLKAADLLNQAVAHDPTFFQAYCQLAWVHDELYHLSFDRTPARLALAEAAIDSAFRLRPDAGEAHLARAKNLYRGYLEYDGALAELEVARQTLPNDARLFELKGYIERRARGNWEESYSRPGACRRSRPAQHFLAQQIVVSYDDLRRYADEEAVLDRMLAIEPNDADTKVLRAYVELDWKADTRPLHQLIDEIRATRSWLHSKVSLMSWLYCALAERDAAAAANALAALGENGFGNDDSKIQPAFRRRPYRSNDKRRCQSTRRFHCCTRGAGETGSRSS